eukprot:scaffold227380_cov36-Prasinocladus_malaysianus.AAC.1
MEVYPAAMTSTQLFFFLPHLPPQGAVPLRSRGVNTPLIPTAMSSRTRSPSPGACQTSSCKGEIMRPFFRSVSQWNLGTDQAMRPRTFSELAVVPHGIAVFSGVSIGVEQRCLRSSQEAQADWGAAIGGPDDCTEPRLHPCRASGARLNITVCMLVGCNRNATAFVHLGTYR